MTEIIRILTKAILASFGVLSLVKKRRTHHNPPIETLRDGDELGTVMIWRWMTVSIRRRRDKAIVGNYEISVPSSVVLIEIALELAFRHMYGNREDMPSCAWGLLSRLNPVVVGF